MTNTTRDTLLLAALRSMDDLMFIFDAEGRFLEVFRQDSHDLLMNPEDFLGKVYSDVLPAHLVHELTFAFDSLRSGNGVYEFIYRLEINQGLKWFSVKMTPILEGQELIGFSAIIRNRTRDHEMEDRVNKTQRMLGAIAAATGLLVDKFNYLTAITGGLRILGQGVGVDRVYLFKNDFDKENQIHFCSQKYEWTSLGVTAQIDNPALQYVPFSDMEFFIKPLIEKKPFVAIVSKIPDENVRLILESQSILSILVLPIFVGDYFWGFVGFDECRTERVWQEDEVSLLRSYTYSITSAIERHELLTNTEKARASAELESRTKSEFLANMSHEIRTPLNAIIGFSNLIGDGVDRNSNISVYASHVSSSANHLMELINNILDYSKMEAGKMELDWDAADVEDMLAETEGMMSAIARKKQLPFNVIRHNEFSRFVKMDRLRIKQVLVNLISNAIKFTTTGKVELSVSSRKIAPKSDKIILRFEVKDTGIGIKEDQLSRLFQAFTQADPSTARNFGGSGLGLMISNRILNLFDSALEVESIPGVGSTFSFEIEVEEVLEKRDEVKDTFEAEHFAKLQKKVLIVEDNELNMFIAATLLKGILPKCTIFEALNYSSALNIFEYEKPDLVFLDLEIPVLSGFEIAGQMREMEKRMEREETTVIALTARVTAETRMNCIDAGMNDYLTKPIELNELHRVLVDFLEKITRRDK